jgi:hypothetical protein
MRRLRANLTYSNVMVTVLAVVVLGGGSAYAATQILPKNSVGAKQLKKGAVTPAKLSKAAMSALAGAKGPAGPAGPTGPAGAQGTPGSSGGATTTAVPHARIRLRTHEESIGDNTEQRVVFDQVVEDNAGMADLTAHPTTLLATRSGLYLVAANLEWHQIEGEGRVGGSLFVPSPDGVGRVTDKSEAVYAAAKAGVQYLGQPFAETIRLEAGQYVALSAYQKTGQTNTISDVDDGTWLEMTYLGP